MRGIDETVAAAEVLENPVDDRGRLDAGDDPQVAGALQADFIGPEFRACQSG